MKTHINMLKIINLTLPPPTNSKSRPEIFKKTILPDYFYDKKLQKIQIKEKTLQ